MHVGRCRLVLVPAEDRGAWSSGTRVTESYELCDRKAGNQTSGLWKRSQCSELPSYLSSPYVSFQKGNPSRGSTCGPLLCKWQ